MRDPTAQTEQLTAGQQIVAAWETDIIAEPCELAECIDNRIAAAVLAEREACARICDSMPNSNGAAAHAANEIRARK